MGFYHQEYCNGLPSPSPEDLPDPGIEPMSPVAPASACEFFATEPPWKMPGFKSQIYHLPDE